MVCVKCCRFHNLHFAHLFVLRQFSSRRESNISLSNSPLKESPTTDQYGLKVAVIGCPNAGKSALTNALVRANVCANTTTSITEDNCQLVVMDSPGLIGTHHAKNLIKTHSDDKILADPENAIKRAAHVLVVQDCSLRGEYIQHRILHLLHRYAHIPTTLVINKIDLIPKKSDLLRLADIFTEGLINGEKIERSNAKMGRLDAIKTQKSIKKIENEGFSIHHTASIQKRDENWHSLYNHLLQKPAHKCSWSDTRKLYLGQNGWPNFKSVFFVSCHLDEGINELRQYLQSLSTTTTWRYNKDVVSTKDAKVICLENARSKFLDVLPPYIGYSLQLNICEWEIDNKDNFLESNVAPSLRIIIDVNCDKERPARLVSNVCETIEQSLTQQLHLLFNLNVLLCIRTKLNGRMFFKNTHLTEQSKK